MMEFWKEALLRGLKSHSRGAVGGVQDLTTGQIASIVLTVIGLAAGAVLIYFITGTSVRADLQNVGGGFNYEIPGKREVL